MRKAVRPWRDYIWLLLHALRKLPPATATFVFRGCPKSPDELGLELTAGFDFTWASFSSTATTQDVMQSFVGQSGPRTLMTIELVEASGCDVNAFSLYPKENEILFPPNMCFEVVSSFDAGNDLIMVPKSQIQHVEERVLARELLDGIEHDRRALIERQAWMLCLRTLCLLASDLDGAPGGRVEVRQLRRCSDWNQCVLE